MCIRDRAVTNCSVPKITLRIGASFGAGEYGMAGRSFDPRFMFSWPNNKLSVMGGEQAGKTMSQVAVESAKRKGEEPNMEMIKMIEDLGGKIEVLKKDNKSEAKSKKQSYKNDTNKEAAESSSKESVDK